jgi:lantibiotic leader peptide-processing serine protease
MKRLTFLLVVALLLIVGISANAQGSASYILIANGTGFPANLAEQVSAAGGTLDVVYREFNVAVATASNPNFASRISGVRSVTRDVGFRMEAPVQQVAYVAETSRGGGRGGRNNTQTTTTTAPVVSNGFGYPPFSGDNDPYFDLQWGHNAVHAQEAWTAGNTGQGVRVAVLDTGFDLDHPDLAPNINLSLSRDFTGEGLQYTLADTFSHGTHTAGTIAAADNGFGTIGVAPGAELVLVKVLGDEGDGDFANIIAGIYYAAIVDADIISMSLGTVIPQNLKEDGVSFASAVAELRIATAQAVAFAYQNGTTVIVSAGNAAADLDGDGSNKRFMTGLPHTIGVSALTPIGWATDPLNIDLNQVSSYTNYGTSMVELGAPGGDVLYPGNESCTVGPITRPCYVFDLVFSTGNNGWYWSGGTSMATPHVSGIAALIISANGGDMHPSQVAAALRDNALDLGASGKDDYYGHGAAQSGY